eukprot:NODE_19505_length_840_cov_3.471248.p1 GENE.NODE_19505_length_840_cov_3.471248~~NODE_19505_length_840_cov_3.471248.p1  ORF type:complete len:204 (-),score=50.79 NODE_19505_length_840_cov_3.471248:71-682(-)
MCMRDMHWLRDHDYGRDIVISYGGEERTLLAFWEDFLPTRVPPIPDAWEMESLYGRNSASWRDMHPQSLFHAWGTAQAEAVCERIYSKLETNHADGTRNIAQPFELSEELFKEWVGYAHDVTLLAAQRIGFLLNDILEHQKHKKAALDGRALAPRGKHRWHWEKFLMNLFIALLIVPLMLYMLNQHLLRSSGGWRQPHVHVKT